MASKIEEAVYQKLLGAPETYKDVRRHPRVFLTDASVSANIDFQLTRIIFSGGEVEEWHEVNGYHKDKARFQLVKKLWRVYGPGPLVVWEGSWQYPKIVDVVKPRMKRLYGEATV